MTASMLIGFLNEKFGLSEWPRTFEVDHETYANCCQAIFDWHIKNHIYILHPGVGYELSLLKVGLNNGLMFKNVELILKK
jgi:hypothetical protein